MKGTTIGTALLVAAMSTSVYANARYATQVSTDVITGQVAETKEAAAKDGEMLLTDLLNQSSFELSQSQRTRVVTVDNRSFKITKSDISINTVVGEDGLQAISHRLIINISITTVTTINGALWTYKKSSRSCSFRSCVSKSL